MKMNELLKYITYKSYKGDVNVEISGIEQNSNLVQGDNCFICIKGYTVDGHQFIDDAIEKGASVVVLQKYPDTLQKNVLYIQVENTNKTIGLLANAFYSYPSKQLRNIGVTGTNGKTTVANMINDALRLLGNKTAVLGTLGIDMDGEKIDAGNTTVDALTMQKTFDKMVKKGIEDVTMEVSSHGLILGRLDGVDFQTAVFTNLTQDHLDFHKTMDQYGYAKGLLFSGLGHDVSKNKTAILNVDDDYYDFFAPLSSAKLLTYGIDKEADIRAKDISYTDTGTTFVLVYQQLEYLIHTNFIGRFNVYNALAAIAALLDKGLSVIQIQRVFQDVKPVEGRMEKIINPKGIDIYIDYAHTPDGIEKALEGLKGFAKGKIYCVIGAGGNRDKEKRPIMARKASENADFVVITTDNPRDESYESIMNDMVKGLTHTEYVAIGDRKEAIYECLNRAQKDDVVIIAGKGPETYQIIKGKKIPFNDKETVNDFFKKRI